MRWIAIVVGLLVGNVIAVAILITAAGDQSARVLPDYYRRAAAYDETLAEARASAALGWAADAAVRGDAIEVRIFDREGAPLPGASVTVSVDPRGRTDRTSNASLAEAAPGVYRGTIAPGAPGLYLVSTNASRGDARFRITATVERRP